MPATIKNKVKILYFEDWEALLIDGIVVLEANAISPGEVLSILGIEFERENLTDIEDVDGYLHPLRSKKKK